MATENDNDVLDGGWEWNLIEIYSEEKLKIAEPKPCDSVGCGLLACVKYRECNNAERIWDGCLDCQQAYYKGWPDDQKELPKSTPNTLTDSHKNAITRKCSKNPTPHFFDFSKRNPNTSQRSAQRNSEGGQPAHRALGSVSQRSGSAHAANNTTPGGTARGRTALADPIKEPLFLLKQLSAEREKLVKTMEDLKRAKTPAFAKYGHIDGSFVVLASIYGTKERVPYWMRLLCALRLSIDLWDNSEVGSAYPYTDIDIERWYKTYKCTGKFPVFNIKKGSAVMRTFIEKIETLYQKFVAKYQSIQDVLHPVGDKRLELAPFNSGDPSIPCLQKDISRAIEFFRNIRLQYPEKDKIAAYEFGKIEIRKVTEEKEFKKYFDDTTKELRHKEAVAEMELLRHAQFTLREHRAADPQNILCKIKLILKYIGLSEDGSIREICDRLDTAQGSHFPELDRITWLRSFADKQTAATGSNSTSESDSDSNSVHGSSVESEYEYDSEATTIGSPGTRLKVMVDEKCEYATKIDMDYARKLFTELTAAATSTATSTSPYNSEASTKTDDENLLSTADEREGNSSSKNPTVKNVSPEHVDASADNSSESPPVPEVTITEPTGAGNTGSENVSMAEEGGDADDGAHSEEMDDFDVDNTRQKMENSTKGAPQVKTPDEQTGKSVTVVAASRPDDAAMSGGKPQEDATSTESDTNFDAANTLANLRTNPKLNFIAKKLEGYLLFLKDEERVKDEGPGHVFYRDGELYWMQPSVQWIQSSFWLYTILQDLVNQSIRFYDLKKLLLGTSRREDVELLYKGMLKLGFFNLGEQTIHSEDFSGENENRSDFMILIDVMVNSVKFWLDGNDTRDYFLRIIVAATHLYDPTFRAHLPDRAKFIEDAESVADAIMHYRSPQEKEGARLILQRLKCGASIEMPASICKFDTPIDTQRLKCGASIEMPASTSKSGTPINC